MFRRFNELFAIGDAILVKGGNGRHMWTSSRRLRRVDVGRRRWRHWNVLDVFDVGAASKVRMPLRAPFLLRSPLLAINSGITPLLELLAASLVSRFVVALLLPLIRRIGGLTPATLYSGYAGCERILLGTLGPMVLNGGSNAVKTDLCIRVKQDRPDCFPFRR